MPLGAMEAGRYRRWKIAKDIDSPCADLSYSYTGANTLAVTMRFSRVVDRPDRDLVIWFTGVIAFRWETDLSALLEVSESLPKCSSERWATSTFPLLTVERSAWLLSYASRDPTEAQGRRHIVLVTLNGVCEVLALPNAVATWVNANDA
jgi:hypothetical protein